MSSSFFRFLKYAKPYWLLIVGAILFGVVKFTLALTLPASLGLVTDKVFLVTELPLKVRLFRLFVILGALTLAFLARSPVTYLRSYLGAVAGHRTIFELRRDLYRHLQRLSLTYYSRQRAGSVISRLINDLNAAQGILTRGVIAVSMDLIFLLGVVVFLFIYDWRLAGVSLFTLPIYGAVFGALNPRLRRVSSAVQEEMAEMSGEVTEKLSGVQVVQSFVREKTEEMNFFTRHRRYYRKVLKRTRLKVTLSTVAEFLTAFGPMLVVGYGGYRVVVGSMTPGQVILFYGFLQHLYLPMRRLADCSALIQEKLAAVDRVFEVRDVEPDIQDKAGAIPLNSPKGVIEFRNLHFSYEPGQPVLQDVSLRIEPGQSVAFVGRSGAGKSTLVNLVPRFYDVDTGAVLVDGVDTRELMVRSLRENIGIVPQDSILFSGTIRENILYGRHNATKREMKEAARMAHVDEFVSILPARYGTLIGERGVSLSGGQKQRISIARAFLRNPRILILDEATSNLDSHAERIIQDALRELMKGRTTLVIAHRLSTIVDCDLVVVLEQGRIVQTGTHESLIREKGPYRRFCREQFGYVQLDELAR